MQKCGFILLFLMTVCCLYSHPIKQIDFDIKIKENGQLTISAKLNLAHLLLQKEIYDYEEYNESYRQMLSFSNEKFSQHLLDNKLDIENKFELFVEGNRLPLKVSWDLKDRKVIPYDWIDINGQFQHEESLFIPITIEAELPFGTKEIQWKNSWPFLDHSLRVSNPKEDKSVLIWIYSGAQEIVPVKNLKAGLGVAFVYFLKHGVKHILPNGIDHILFILCIFLVFTSLKNLFLQVSVFTLAHTVSLALASLGVVQVQGKWIEPLIAFSILCVATQNILGKGVKKERLYLIFAFGLLHGLSFATAFQGKGLDILGFISAVVGFNLGVELGQFFILLIAICFISLPFDRSKSYKDAFTVPLSFLIGSYSLWLISESLFLSLNRY